jgi:hypothetical protein
MSHYLSQFGSLDLPTLEARQDLSTPSLPVRATPLLLGGSYRLHGTERAPLVSATLEAVGDVAEDEWADVETDVTALRAAIGTYAQLWRTSKADETRQWTYAELLAVGQENAPEYVFYQPLVLRFFLPYPVWRAEDETELTFTDLYDATGGDLLLMYTMGGTPGSAVAMTWINEGNYVAYDLQIVVTSGTGTITGLTIENETTGYTGYTLSWAGTLTTGQVLTIDTGAMSVSRTGLTNAYSELTPPSTEARWFALAPGDNVVNVTLVDSATDDSSSIAVSYYSTSA